MKQIALNYFAAFAAKDVDALRAMFAPDVSLRDWDVAAVGIDDVLSACQNTFNATSTLCVTARNLYADGNTVVGELDIMINEDPILKVIDVIEFTACKKIYSIRAFKG